MKKTKILRLLRFIKNEIAVDLTCVRSKFFLFLFNLLPDFYSVRFVKNLFLVFGGCKINIWKTYIRSPFWCDQLSSLTIGSNVFINRGLCIEGLGKVSIGENTQIGPFCKFTTTNHIMIESIFVDKVASVILGSNIWVGAGVIVLPDASISNHTIIAAGAVVKKADGGVWGGIPAQKLRINVANQPPE
ncbi:MAG: acyltransferase [SAR324 cluster bacterium]|nr:acyltransferase [SAR324 cluster bacterium]